MKNLPCPTCKKIYTLLPDESVYCCDGWLWNAPEEAVIEDPLGAARGICLSLCIMAATIPAVFLLVTYALTGWEGILRSARLILGFGL